MRILRALFGISLIVLVLGGILSLPGGDPAQPAARSSSAFDAGLDASAGEVTVSAPVIPIHTVAARELPPYVAVQNLEREINPRVDPYQRFNPSVNIPGGPDPLVGIQAAAPLATDTQFGLPIFNFDGQGYTFVNPPDTVGDVGASHYVQMINGFDTAVAVYDKATAALLSTFALPALGGCTTGNGDPVVLYDHAADRWLLSEFGPGNSLCVLISQTPDPLGAYYSYQFTTPNFPDYPKYGVWQDAYYVSTNENSPANYALNRTAMLSGAPATSQRFTAPDLAGFGFQALTPSDWDGATPPPAGSPNYFMRHRDTEAHGPTGFPTQDFLEVWALHVDWTTPANSSFTQVANIAVAEFDSDLCGLFSFSAIAMPGVAKCSSSSLDPLREVVMFRLQYRNFGAYETLVGNLATDVTGNNDAGIRWFELRKAGAGAWTLFQEGTYAPDAASRWMGAIAMDGAGNIALGYNVSSSTVFPSLRYAGRLATDPPGTLPQGEYVSVAGTASNGSNRYGDYAAMSVDPVDDCTFWFTGEYNPASQWRTRITAFKFASCGVPDFTLSVTPESQAICAGTEALFDVDLGAVGGFADPVTLGASGLPAGSTAAFNINPVTPPGASILTIGNTAGVAGGSYMIDVLGSAGSVVHSAPVALDVFNDLPGAPAPLSPFDGATGVSAEPTFFWAAAPGASGYLLQVATDAGFVNVVYQAEEIATSHTIPAADSLEFEATYFWRVTALNPCGSGAASPAFSFTTATAPTLFCDAPALAIPSPGSASTSLFVPASAILADLNVSVNASHPSVGELVLTLSHNGTAVTLIDRPGVPASGRGCQVGDINATLDDEAALPVEEACAPTEPAIAGTFMPNQALGAFDGMDVGGTWTLTVSDAVAHNDGTLVEWCLLPTYGATPTATPPGPTPTPPPPTPTPTATLPGPTPTSTPGRATPTPTMSRQTPTPPPPTSTPGPPTATPVPGNVLTFVSLAGNGTVGGVGFGGEDILQHDEDSGTWALFFDGSDVGLAGNVDAFAFMGDGSILLSLETLATVSGVGSVDDSDIIRFIPSSLGDNTTGVFEWYFDGSDVGLSRGGEDVDAFGLAPGGALVVSTLGVFDVTGASGNAEDLLLFSPTSLGASTSGTWALFFDGSDVALTASGENVNGVWLDANGDIYLTTSGPFEVAGATGDGGDIFACAPTSTGASTACSFSFFWDGTANGLGNAVVDGLWITK